MKISTVKKLVLEDFPAANRELIQKLAQVLNPFLDQQTTALTSNLTVENLKGRQYTVELKATQTTASVAWDLNEKPSIVVVAKLTKSDGVTAPSGVFSMSWTYTTRNQIALTFQGLDSGTAYKVVIEGRC
jgi:hypothetical protein